MPADRSRRLRWLTSCTLQLALGVASLLVMEAVLRVLPFSLDVEETIGKGWPWLISDPVLGWRQAAGHEHREFSINSHGYRGPEFKSSKSPGISRIICLGDSGTFGVWAPSGRSLRFDSYPLELAEIARQEGDARVEVINAGVIGYTSSHGLRLLVTEILDLAPDVITVRLGFNDHDRSWDPARRAHEPGSWLGRGVLYTFHEWQLTRIALNAYLRISFLHPAPRSVVWNDLDRYEANLRRIVAVSNEHGIRLLFIDYPIRPMSRGSGATSTAKFKRRGHENLAELYEVHDAYQAVLQAVVTEERVPLLRSRLRLEDLRAFSAFDLAHPNQAGARELARLIWERVHELGWIAE